VQPIVTAPLPPTESLLFDILSTIRPCRAERLTDLSSGRWQQMADIARQHRLEPVLYCAAQAQDLETQLPSEISAQWHEGYRRAAYRALAARRMLSSLKNLLDDAAIPFLALKGAWLAWHVYSDPALRPMRDIDIIVDKGDLHRAFSLLRDHGFIQLNWHGVAMETLLKTSKHLPKLECPKSGIVLEVHARLFTPEDEQAAPADLATFHNLQARQVILDGVAYPCATDSLLHIIVHAVEDHFFNNGPVFIADIHQILRHSPIEWPRFWSMAAEAGWTNACKLVFDIVEHLHGTQPIDWPAHGREPASAEVIQAALGLCLQDRAAKHNVTLTFALARAKGPMAKLALLTRKLVPLPGKLAETGNLPADSRRAVLYYPAWLFGNIRTMLKGAAGQRSGSNNVASVVHWLNRQNVQ
jgi:hypothetical protein